ncbi:MAG: DUF3486 family protein [Akkermansiaceae bacterium]|nr:DUF3486 family protein [Verrucomicrobiales bacterium]
MSNRRKGKIASLPFDLRTKVNVMLRDGAKYTAVMKFLESQDVFGLNEQNITNWHQGGYADWLKEQERLGDMQAKREFAFQIVKENEGSKLHEANLHLAASQLYEALSDFDIENLKGLLKEKPENYAAIVNSLAKLSKGALDMQTYRDKVQEQKRKIEAALQTVTNKGGITKEALATIEQAAAML